MCPKPTLCPFICTDDALKVPPIFKLPVIPTPPTTCKAPLVVEFDCPTTVSYPTFTELLTYSAPPTPTPPATTNAPVVIEVELEVLDIRIALVVVDPLPVTVCNVLVFEIVIFPVLVLTAISVPAVMLV